MRNPYRWKCYAGQNCRRFLSRGDLRTHLAKCHPLPALADLLAAAPRSDPKAKWRYGNWKCPMCDDILTDTGTLRDARAIRKHAERFHR